jgi:hypothetical protein
MNDECKGAKMKRYSWFVLGCLLIGGAAFGQSFSVTSPNGDESWELGKTQNITWTYSMIPNNTKVKLMLWKDGSKFGDIVTDLPIGSSGSGSYAWTVGSYQGGTAEDGTGYKVRIRDMQNQYDVDQSNQPFTIAPAAEAAEPPSKPGGLKAHVGQVATVMVAISINEPTKTSVWTIGETHTIRWSARDTVKYPLWLFLVSADRKIPIVDIGKTSGPFRQTEKTWTVTDNLYDQLYCVRITSADKAYETHSQPFRIQASRTRSFKVLPSAVYNKVHWHNYVGGDIWPGQKFTQGVTAIPDPGGRIIKYGYQRWYEDEDDYGYTLHRSFVFFDLGAVISQLKGPATVKSAFIDWKKAANSPQACASHTWCLDAPMVVGDGSNMFGETFSAFPKHLIAGDQQVLVQMAQRWLSDPAKNYGLVVCAANEGQKEQNGQCVQFCDNVFMTIEIEEKLNK